MCVRIILNCDLRTEITKPVMQLWAVHSHKNTNTVLQEKFVALSTFKCFLSPPHNCIVACRLITGYIISYLYYIQVNPVTGEKQVHRPLDIQHVKRQNKNAPTIIGTSPKI
jgi:hypothetical protein